MTFDTLWQVLQAGSAALILPSSAHIFSVSSSDVVARLAKIKAEIEI